MLNCQITLSQGMTAAFVVIASGAIGWMVNIILNNSKDNGILKEATDRISRVLERLETRQEATDAAISELQSKLSRLQGEHYSLTDEGQHPHFKKKPSGRG